MARPGEALVGDGAHLGGDAQHLLEALALEDARGEAEAGSRDGCQALAPPEQVGDGYGLAGHQTDAIATSTVCDDCAMAVRAECRHYIMQTVRNGERLERCRLGANDTVPFGCPDGCLFFERRSTSSAGWQVGEGDAPGPERPRR